MCNAKYSCAMLKKLDVEVKGKSSQFKDKYYFDREITQNVSHGINQNQ